MSAVSALPQDIVEWLSEQEELEDITFMTEFPPSKKAVPLRKAIVAVGLDEVSIKDSFTENNQGVLVENEYCRLASLKIRITVHVPFSYGGARCHDIFTTIIDCLTFASDLNIVESGCESISSDRNTDALVLGAWIDIEADFCPAVSTNLNYQSFLSKTHLCSTHITDSSIHVTAAEKELWNSPSVTGNYLGTDTTTRTVSLGFQPKAVFVFAEQLPPVLIDFTNSVSYCYQGMATRVIGSQGIEINSDGFRLLSSSTYNIDSSYPRLNQGGISYYYIALK